MAKLTAKTRNALPTSAFAGPGSKLSQFKTLVTQRMRWLGPVVSQCLIRAVEEFK